MPYRILELFGLQGRDIIPWLKALQPRLVIFASAEFSYSLTHSFLLIRRIRGLKTLGASRL
jgi:hypothetical protein